MAKAITLDSRTALHGKIGGFVYSRQRDGTLTVRAAWKQKAPQTSGEKRCQNRLKLAIPFMRSVLRDNGELKAAYTAEAAVRGMRVSNLAVSDFLTDPVVSDLDLAWYLGQAGDSVFVVTGDEFKVVRVRVAISDVPSGKLEEGFAVRVTDLSAKVWLYKAQVSVPPGDSITVEATVTDRCGHSVTATAVQRL